MLDNHERAHLAQKMTKERTAHEATATSPPWPTWGDLPAADLRDYRQLPLTDLLLRSLKADSDQAAGDCLQASAKSMTMRARRGRRGSRWH